MRSKLLNRGLLAGLLLCHAASLVHGQVAAPQAAAATSEQWEVQFMGGQRVGYSRHRQWQETREGRSVFKSLAEEHISIRRFGQQISMESSTEVTETPDGQLLGFTYVMQNPPAQPSKSVGVMNGRTMTIETTIAGRASTKTIELDADVKSPAYQDRLFKENPPKPGEVRSFKAFVPEFAKTTEVRITADDLRPVKLLDGRERKLLKLKVEQSILPGVGMRVYLDEKGEALRAEADLLGITSYAVTREVALQTIAGAELDVAVGTLVRVANPPAKLHQAQRASYRLTATGVDLSQLVPESDSQTPQRSTADSVDLSVTAAPIPKAGSVAQPAKKVAARYLAESPFLQTKDARVLEHAQRAAAGSVDPSTIATRMEKYIQTELKKKNFSTALASAAEVAKTMEGDCTEHACLLAAMLRTKQIPARVAVGLVYVDKLGAFGGHMWTEAWLDGRWIGLDGTLGNGGVGPGHIKLADSDMGDDGPAPILSFVPLMNVLGTLKIEVLKVDR